MNLLFKVVSLLFIIGLCYGDMFIHNPRGSNNRLNETSAKRKNGNRLFNTQNNDRGGYNVGDRGVEAFENEAEQYQMKYFQSSESHKTSLVLEWTIQHGFGTNKKLNSDVIIQMMCQQEGQVNDLDRLRDGLNTESQTFRRSGNVRETYDEFVSRKNEHVNLEKGLHESFDYYDKCKSRMRNKGLFIANKSFRRQDSTFTRQNDNGARSGYECPEERDYFPYWEPSPWIDIAILTSNNSKCEFYQKESFNVQPRGECIIFQNDSENPESVIAKLTPYNNETTCMDDANEYNRTSGEIRWIEVNNYLELRPEFQSKTQCEAADLKWGFTINNYYTEHCFEELSAPDCQEGKFTRVNHNGNAADSLDMINYDWNIPHFRSNNTQRYNISTDDYDPQDTFAGDETPNYNQENNPQIDVGNDTNIQLKMATNQLGRTFQDRTNVFKLVPRPGNLNNQKIHNVNVRGKRGNIVQVYPAVEYDFTPSCLKIQESDAVHYQWTGSNTHNNGKPAGDGQAGDAGQGTSGTDRHNCVALDHPSRNYPMDFENGTSMFMKIDEIKWYLGVENPAKIDIAISAASSGFFINESDLNASNEDNALNVLLNNAPASYEGFVATFENGIYHYMCTRNNAFTNRSQKGKLIVGESEECRDTL